MSRTRGLVALAVLVGVVVHAAEALQVSTLTRDGHVLVSFELAGAYTEDIRSMIRSGLQTTFRYDVDLKRRAVFWPDNTVASAILATAVRYDNLTEQYSIARTLDGRVEKTVVVDDEGEVQALLTQYDRVPLFSTASLEPNSEYHVSASLKTRPHHAWFVWPWTRSAASGAADFTFLP